MQILLNNQNEITSYATIGGFEKGIEVEKYPDTFIDVFEPRMFKYVDGAIVKNDVYNKESEQEVTKSNYEQRIQELEQQVQELFDLLSKEPQA